MGWELELQFAGGVWIEGGRGGAVGAVGRVELDLRGDLEGVGALAEEHEELLLVVERRLVVGGVAGVHDAVFGGVDGLAGGYGGGGGAVCGQGCVGPERAACCAGGEKDRSGEEAC